MARCRVWDLRSNSIVRTLETGKEVTSIEVGRDGKSITTADGKEVPSLPARCFSQSHPYPHYLLEHACPPKGGDIATCSAKGCRLSHPSSCIKVIRSAHFLAWPAMDVL